MIKRYLLIFGNTINPVLLLNSEHIIPEKNKQAEKREMNSMNPKPVLKNSVYVSAKRLAGINTRRYPTKNITKIVIDKKK